MAYSVQVSFDLNRGRTPQRIIDEIIRNNTLLTRFGGITNFEFDLSNFQHAIEILSHVDSTKPVPHLKPYLKYAKADLEELSSFSEYFHKFNDRDLKRKTMENIGVGISSLFMNKSFNIDWRDIAHIPKAHFPRGIKVKKADFIAYNGRLRYYYEAKGTTRGNINSKIGTAKEQLRNIIYTAEMKLAFVTYIPCDDLDFPPTLFVADPIIGENIDIDIGLVRMLHYQNVLNFANFTSTYKSYSKLVIELFKKKHLETIGKVDEINLAQIDVLSVSVQSDYERDISNLERRNINNMEFVGKSIKNTIDNFTITFFRGVERGIIEQVILLNPDVSQLTDIIVVDNGKKSSIFSDGTIFHVEMESGNYRNILTSGSIRNQESHMDKPPNRYKNTISSSFNQGESKEKEKILMPILA